VACADQSTRFKRILALPTCSDKIVDLVWDNYAAKMTAVSNRDQARRLYRQAKRLPQSGTRQLLSGAGYAVDGVFDASSDKASFVRAFDLTKCTPLLLKLHESQEQAEREVRDCVATVVSYFSHCVVLI
jgi:hypothetical protein